MRVPEVIKRLKALAAQSDDPRQGEVVTRIEQLTARKFAELAEYFIDHADPTSKTGRSDILLARACADTSRLNLDGALKTAHAIANARPPEKGDRTDAYMTAARPADEPEPE